MVELMQYVFTGQNFVIAFLVWAFIAVCRKAVKEFPKPRIIYFIISLVITPLIAALFLSKLKIFTWVDWGFASVVSFILANLYQKVLKKLGNIKALEILNKVT